MKLGIIFMPLTMGTLMGEVIKQSIDGKTVTIKNPAMIVPRQNEIALAPILHFVEEKTIEVDLDQVSFKKLFTPNLELTNIYNKVFGTGIVIASNELQF
jgi:hypothetical protein